MAKAATKEKPKSTAVAVVKPSAVVDVAAMKAAMQASLADIAAATGSDSGNTIRIGQNKTFKLPGAGDHPGPIKLVIVDHVTLREWYDRPFDKANPCPPACAAVSRTPQGMVPMKAVPLKQSDSCEGCPKNQWDTGGPTGTGKGKACKENRYLAVLPADADATTKLYTMAVSPTGLKAYDAYVRSLSSALQVPSWAVVTTVSFDPNVDYPSLRFSDPVPASDDLKAVAFNLLTQARATLLELQDFSGYVKPGAKGKKR